MTTPVSEVKWMTGQEILEAMSKAGWETEEPTGGGCTWNAYYNPGPNETDSRGFVPTEHAYIAMTSARGPSHEDEGEGITLGFYLSDEGNPDFILIFANYQHFWTFWPAAVEYANDAKTWLTWLLSVKIYLMMYATGMKYQKL